LTPTQFILAGLILFAAHFVAGVTGFGSGILGLPLLAFIVSLDVGKQCLFVLSTGVYLYIMLRWHEHIDWRQLFIMTLFAGIGVPFGMYLYEALPRNGTVFVLGAFVAFVGLRNLFQFWQVRRMPRWAAVVLLIVGGVIQGAFTTGGPVLVSYADEKLTDKSTFRATLCVLWVLLAVMLGVGWTLQHKWQAESFHLSLIGLPFMIAGLVVGERVHHKVSERDFRRGVNVTLLLIGVLLMLSAG